MKGIYYLVGTCLIFLSCTMKQDWSEKSIFTVLTLEELQEVNNSNPDFIKVYENIQEINEENFEKDTRKLDFVDLKYSDFLRFSKKLKDSIYWDSLYENEQDVWKDIFSKDIYKSDSLIREWEDKFYKEGKNFDMWIEFPEFGEYIHYKGRIEVLESNLNENNIDGFNKILDSDREKLIESRDIIIKKYVNKDYLDVDEYKVFKRDSVLRSDPRFSQILDYLGEEKYIFMNPNYD